MMAAVSVNLLIARLNATFEVHWRYCRYNVLLNDGAAPSINAMIGGRIITGVACCGLYMR